MRHTYSKNLTECNMCGAETEENNPVRIGFETRYICDKCLDKIKAIFREVKNENNNTRNAD